MNKKNSATKMLAIVGTVLTWLPILAPIFFTVIFFMARGQFRFDFLMPAELFLLFLFGGGLLTWAAWQAHRHQKLIGWAWGGAVAFVALSQGLAVVTGLAHGDVEPGGWEWLLVITALALYTLAIIITGVGGILLLRNLFRPSQPLPKHP
ncbi:MAG: hypothetical protein R3D55_05850 [Chloroflexota bacterium]